MNAFGSGLIVVLGGEEVQENRHKLKRKQLRFRFCLLYSSKGRGQMFGLVSHFTRLPLTPSMPNQVSTERREMLKSKPPLIISPPPQSTGTHTTHVHTSKKEQGSVTETSTRALGKKKEFKIARNSLRSPTSHPMSRCAMSPLSGI